MLPAADGDTPSLPSMPRVSAFQARKGSQAPGAGYASLCGRWGRTCTVPLLPDTCHQTGTAYAFASGALTRQIDATEFGGTAIVKDVAAKEKEILGYLVYRLDELRCNSVLRLTSHPVKDHSLTDRPETPRAERRRYYVVAVDGLGQEGMPSTGAWLFGRP